MLLAFKLFLYFLWCLGKRKSAFKHWLLAKKVFFFKSQKLDIPNLWLLAYKLFLKRQSKNPLSWFTFMCCFYTFILTTFNFLELSKRQLEKNDSVKHPSLIEEMGYCLLIWSWAGHPPLRSSFWDWVWLNVDFFTRVNPILILGLPNVGRPCYLAHAPDPSSDEDGDTPLFYTQAQMYKLFTSHHIQNTVLILLIFVKELNCWHSPKKNNEKAHYFVLDNVYYLCMVTTWWVSCLSLFAWVQAKTREEFFMQLLLRNSQIELVEAKGHWRAGDGLRR